jgi:hypothetical protein
LFIAEDSPEFTSCDDGGFTPHCFWPFSPASGRLNVDLICVSEGLIAALNDLHLSLILGLTSILPTPLLIPRFVAVRLTMLPFRELGAHLEALRPENPEY